MGSVSLKIAQPNILTPRLLLRLANQDDIAAIIKYFVDNKAYLTPFYPKWMNNFFTTQYWQNQVEANLYEFQYRLSLRLFLFRQNNLEQDHLEIIGCINFTNFLGGSAQYCNVGYSLAEKEQGKGYMTEALKAASDYVFQEFNIHRIMANYIPHNQRSGNLLKRLNFVVEGYARDYLLINDKWEDHILTSLTNSDWQYK